MQIYRKIANILKPLEKPQRIYNSNYHQRLTNTARLFPFEETQINAAVLTKTMFGQPTKNSDITSILILNGFVSHQRWCEIVDEIDNAQHAQYYLNTKVYRQTDHAKHVNGTIYSYEVGTVVGYAVRATRIGTSDVILPILVKWGDLEGVAKHQQPTAYTMKELCLYDNKETKTIGPVGSVLLGNTGEIT